MNHSKNLNKVIPALISKLDDEITTSDRKDIYAAQVLPLSQVLQDRFTELAPSSEELGLSVDMEAKQDYEEQINDFLQLVVVPTWKLKMGEDTPEWLLPRKKRVADFYEEAFGEIGKLSADLKGFIDRESGKSVSVVRMGEVYGNWKAIFESQMNKGELLRKVAEIVDIKQALIGCLRLLDANPQEIQFLIYEVSGE